MSFWYLSFNSIHNCTIPLSCLHYNIFSTSFYVFPGLNFPPFCREHKNITWSISTCEWNAKSSPKFREITENEERHFWGVWLIGELWNGELSRRVMILESYAWTTPKPRPPFQTTKPNLLTLPIYWANIRELCFYITLSCQHYVMILFVSGNCLGLKVLLKLKTKTKTTKYLFIYPYSC